MLEELKELRKQEQELLSAYYNSDDPGDQIYYWELLTEVEEKIRELEKD